MSDYPNTARCLESSTAQSHQGRGIGVVVGSAKTPSRVGWAAKRAFRRGCRFEKSDFLSLAVLRVKKNPQLAGTPHTKEEILRNRQWVAADAAQIAPVSGGFPRKQGILQGNRWSWGPGGQFAG